MVLFVPLEYFIRQTVRISLYDIIIIVSVVLCFLPPDSYATLRFISSHEFIFNRCNLWTGVADTTEGQQCRNRTSGPR